MERLIRNNWLIFHSDWPKPGAAAGVDSHKNARKVQKDSGTVVRLCGEAGHHGARQHSFVLHAWR